MSQFRLTADFCRREPRPASISTPNTSSTMPQMRLMLMPANGVKSAALDDAVAGEQQRR